MPLHSAHADADPVSVVPLNPPRSPPVCAVPGDSGAEGRRRQSALGYRTRRRKHAQANNPARPFVNGAGRFRCGNDLAVLGLRTGSGGILISHLLGARIKLLLHRVDIFFHSGVIFVIIAHFTFDHRQQCAQLTLDIF